MKLTLHFGNFTLEFLVSLLKAGDLLRLCFNPISYPLGEFFGASVSLKVFAFVYLGAKHLDQILVLFEPVTPSPGTGGTHCRVELVPSQSEERLRLFPFRPALLAVFPRHDSAAAENWADQLGYGVEPLPAVLHPGERLAEQCIGLGEFGRIGRPQPLAILLKERLERLEHFGDPPCVRPEIVIPTPETQWASIVALQAVDFGLEVARVISTALFPRLFVPRYTRTDPHSLV